MSRAFVWLLGVGCAVLSGVAPAQGADATLVPREAAMVDAAAAAYYGGDASQVLESLRPLIARLDAPKREAVDTALAQRGVPPLVRVLAEARLSQLREGGRPPRLGHQEAALVLPELHGQVEAALQAAADAAVFAEPLPRPASVEAYEPLLWEVHVLSNRLSEAGAVADSLLDLARRVPRRRADDDAGGAASTGARDVDYRALSEQVRARAAELTEREIELRIDRLGLALATLERGELNRERFFAAFSWEVDARTITGFLASRDARALAGRERLNQPRLADEVAAAATRAQTAAGDTTLKAQALFLGLHWWLRGRYGLGSEAFGLAKSAAALHSPAAAFALYMPSATPVPVPRPADGTMPVPLFDRRHYYWWAWEDRRISYSAWERSSRRYERWTEWENRYTITTTHFL